MLQEDNLEIPGYPGEAMAICHTFLQYNDFSLVTLGI